MHIFSKLGGCGSKIESATPLWNFNLKGAWQAQFLSHTLLILENCIVFEDKQMILVSFIKIHKRKKVINFGHSCHIHFWVIPGLRESLIITTTQSVKKKLWNTSYFWSSFTALLSCWQVSIFWKVQSTTPKNTNSVR